jgi:hypothetical protein
MTCCHGLSSCLAYHCQCWRSPYSARLSSLKSALVRQQLRNPDNSHTFTGWRGAGGGERRHRPMRQSAVTTDRIDYWIRRDVAPRLHQSNVNPARDRRAALMVIGRLLRDQYNALATPVPPHLAALVEKIKNAEIGETSGHSKSLCAQR